MLYSTLAMLITMPAVRATACSNAEFAQCGGHGFSGDSCCPSYDECKVVNHFFSQCQPKDLCLNPQYGQCGGQDSHQPPRPWTPENHHQNCCPDSFFCSYQNQYFSQCVFNTTANTTCASAYDQCGGHGWAGKTCCIPGYECVAQSDYYSGCSPLPVCSNARYGQCGGLDADGNPWTEEYHHSGCCPDGFECSYKSSYFSQCVKSSSRAAAAALAEAAPVTGDMSPRAVAVNAQLAAVAPKRMPPTGGCTIGADCASAPQFTTPVCSTSADCAAGLSCVVESQYYSQCVNCSATSFAQQCTYMSEAFLPHAEKTCGINRCPGRCPGHTDAECADPAVCVVQADKNWAQCIECNATTFNSDCKYWSASIRAAAELKCGLTCPK